jgi:hypothetical protein
MEGYQAEFDSWFIGSATTAWSQLQVLQPLPAHTIDEESSFTVMPGTVFE